MPRIVIMALRGMGVFGFEGLRGKEPKFYGVDFYHGPEGHRRQEYPYARFSEREVSV